MTTFNSDPPVVETVSLLVAGVFELDLATLGRPSNEYDPYWKVAAQGDTALASYIKSSFADCTESCEFEWNSLDDPLAGFRFGAFSDPIYAWLEIRADGSGTWEFGPDRATDEADLIEGIVRNYKIALIPEPSAAVISRVAFIFAIGISVACRVARQRQQSVNRPGFPRGSFRRVPPP